MGAARGRNRGHLVRRHSPQARRRAATRKAGRLRGGARSHGRRCGRRARVFVFGHLALGNLHVNVTGPAPDDERVDDAVLRLVLDHGGSIAAEHGIGRAKARWLGQARSPEELAVQAAIKHALDPAGLLNPGVLHVAAVTVRLTDRPVATLRQIRPKIVLCGAGSLSGSSGSLGWLTRLAYGRLSSHMTNVARIWRRRSPSKGAPLTVRAGIPIQ